MGDRHRIVEVALTFRRDEAAGKRAMWALGRSVLADPGSEGGEQDLVPRLNGTFFPVVGGSATSDSGSHHALRAPRLARAGRTDRKERAATRVIYASLRVT